MFLKALFIILKFFHSPVIRAQTLEQYCPMEFSALAKIFCSSAIQYGGHWLPVVLRTLNRESATEDQRFKLWLMAAV